jgi:hypothetical protein
MMDDNSIQKLPEDNVSSPANRLYIGLSFQSLHKKLKTLWISIIDSYIKLMLEYFTAQWDVNAPSTYHTTFYTSGLDENLYQSTDGGFRKMSPKPTNRRTKHPTFNITSLAAPLQEDT